MTAGIPPQGRGGGVIVSTAGPSMLAVLHELALPPFRRYAVAWASRGRCAAR